MFKYKIKVILKSGYEIRVRAKDYNIKFIQFDSTWDYTIIFTKPNHIKDYFKHGYIESIIVKRWYQFWD